VSQIRPKGADLSTPAWRAVESPFENGPPLAARFEPSRFDLAAAFQAAWMMV
jgi:hypothetical protein